jgi:hypothetical protein
MPAASSGLLKSDVAGAEAGTVLEGAVSGSACAGSC